MANLPQTNKALGQHWLQDTASLTAMVEAVAVNDQDTVLEIGPGPGTLTHHLVRAAKQVVAVEFDAVLAANLPQNIKADNLSVIHEDIIRFDFGSLPAGYKVVANIPYYLTSNLIRRLSETANRPSCIALLVQKEVAERAAALPGKMSLLSVTAQFYWQVSLGVIVPAKLFTPPPKVDSQILVLQQKDNDLGVEPSELFRLVKAGFSERRKTLSNALSGGLQLSKPEANELLIKAKLDPMLRAQNLSLNDWHKLYKVL